MQTGHDDHKSLEPHPDAYDNRDQPQRQKICPHTSYPQKLWRNSIAQNQRPIVVRVRAMHSVPDHIALVRVAAVPTEEGFHQISINDNQSRGEHHLCHVVHVAHGDETLQTIKLAQRNRQQQNHREACIDRPRNEIRGKNRRVPSGNDADRKIEADNRMHRKHQWRCQPGKQQISRFVAMPVTRRATPAHRQHAVDHRESFAPGAVPQSREIGNQSDEPKHCRHCCVSRNGKHVPHQRAAELRPDAHRVWIGEQPIGEPRPPEVHHRKDSRLRHGK